MTTVQTVAAVYKGYRFRSRLEARWAIFFEALGVPYECNPEGFLTSDGLRYEPSFWLPVQECWVDADRCVGHALPHTAASAVAAETCSPIYIFCAPIRPLSNGWPARNGTILAPAPFAIRQHVDGGCSAPYVWSRCPVCDKLDLQHWGKGDGKCCLGNEHEGMNGRGLPQAYLKASRAHFSYDKRIDAYRWQA